MKHFLFRKSVSVLVASTVLGNLLAEERTLTPEQMEAIAKQGELEDGQNARPAKLPDLTKGEPMPGAARSHRRRPHAYRFQHPSAP